MYGGDFLGDLSLYKDIGKRIRERRKQLGFTQEQLAEIIDVTPQMISTAENGIKGIRPENIIKLSNALSISCDYLLTGSSSSSDFSFILETIKRVSKGDLENIIEILHLIKNASDNDDSTPL